MPSAGRAGDVEGDIWLGEQSGSIGVHGRDAVVGRVKPVLVAGPKASDRELGRGWTGAALLALARRIPDPVPGAMRT